VSPRQPQTLLVEEAYDLLRGAQDLETLEDQVNGSLDGRIRIQ
jgi:hypothetical protein